MFDTKTVVTFFIQLMQTGLNSGVQPTGLVFLIMSLVEVLLLTVLVHPTCFSTQ